MSTPLPTPAIPDLEFRCPDCPLCDAETSAMDGCFDCESCGMSWRLDGTHGYRMNEDTPQCTAEISPWEDRVENAEYPILWDLRYRCLLEAGHDVAPNDVPHRGARIDRADACDTHEWRAAKTEVEV